MTAKPSSPSVSFSAGALELIAHIWNQGYLSRTELAHITSIPLSTISRIISELQPSGLLREVGKGKSTGGREPYLLGINPDFGCVVCLDMSGGVISYGISDACGELSHTGKESYRAYDAESISAQLIDIVAQLLRPEFCSKRPLAIGVCSPGVVSLANDAILDSSSPPLRNFPIGQILNERFHLPVFASHDTAAAVLAEKYFGVGIGRANLAYLYLSNGIGTGIIVDHRIYRGDRGGSGELGHHTVERNGARCTCGKFGCLETVASIPAILNQVRRLLNQNADTRLRDMLEGGRELDINLVAEAARSGDALCTDVLAAAADYAAYAASSILNLLDMEQLIVGGDLAYTGLIFMEPFRNALRRYTLYTNQAEVVEPRFREEAGLKGASLLALHRVLTLNA